MTHPSANLAARLMALAAIAAVIAATG